MLVLASPSPAPHTTAVSDSRAGSEPWHCLPGTPCPGSGKVSGAAEHGVTREKAQSSAWLAKGSGYSYPALTQLCLGLWKQHLPALCVGHPAPSHQRGAEASQPPLEPGVGWLQHSYLIGRLWKQMPEHLSCLRAGPAVSLWDPSSADRLTVCPVCVSPSRLRLLRGWHRRQRLSEGPSGGDVRVQTQLPGNTL